MLYFLPLYKHPLTIPTNTCTNTHINTHTHIHTATSNTGGLSTGLVAGIVVVCVVVILLTFLADCGVGVIVHVVYQKKSKQSTSMWCACTLLRRPCDYVLDFPVSWFKIHDYINLCTVLNDSAFLSNMYLPV